MPGAAPRPHSLSSQFDAAGLAAILGRWTGGPGAAGPQALPAGRRVAGIAALRVPVPLTVPGLLPVPFVALLLLHGGSVSAPRTAAAPRTAVAAGIATASTDSVSTTDSDRSRKRGNPFGQRQHHGQRQPMWTASAPRTATPSIDGNSTTDRDNTMDSDRNTNSNNQYGQRQHHGQRQKQEQRQPICTMSAPPRATAVMDSNSHHGQSQHHGQRHPAWPATAPRAHTTMDSVSNTNSDGNRNRDNQY